jgi:antitoxin component of MazEF toxin-antitoxin module
MRILTGTTDAEARLVLPPDFASCEVIIERRGDELRVRKINPAKRRYTLAELLAGVTPENIHPEVDMGPPVKNELK